MTVADTTSPWIRQFAPSPEASSRLVCFPHAGGSASYFSPLTRMLPSAVEMLSVQYPGRQDRRHEPCCDSVSELAEHAARALRPWADRPLVLFGHSLGATVAFEVARRLEREGIGPLGLVASGRRAPSRHREEFHHLSDDEQLLAQLRNLSGTESRVLGDEEIMRMVLPALRADYKAVETYRASPGAEVGCPVVALTGDDDPLTGVEEVYAWNEHTRGPCTVHRFAGGHFFLTPHAAEVTSLIAEYIAKWLASPPTAQ
ncbi:thioesterase II family protein [Streptomyces tendae]